MLLLSLELFANVFAGHARQAESSDDSLKWPLPHGTHSEEALLGVRPMPQVTRTD